MYNLMPQHLHSMSIKTKLNVIDYKKYMTQVQQLWQVVHASIISHFMTNLNLRVFGFSW